MRYLVLLLSVLLYEGSIDSMTLWWLMWLAPVPLLWYSARCRSIEMAAMAFIIGVLAQFDQVFLYWHSGASWWDNCLPGLVGGVQFTAVFVVTQWLQKKWRHALSIFIFPVLFTVSEWLIGLGVLGSYGSIAYNQILFLPFAQVAAVGSYLAITFFLSLFASTVAYISVHYKQNMKNVKLAGLIGFTIVALVLIAGFIRLRVTKPSGHIKVGFVNISQPTKYILNPTNANTILDQYMQSFDQLVQQHVDVIMIPEEAFLTDQKNEKQIKQRLSSYAKAHHVMMVIGVRQRVVKNYNAVWLFGDDGKQVGSYYKRHLVPHIESDHVTPIKTTLEFHSKGHLFAIAICRDMDFKFPAATYGKHDVRLVFAPAWDFKSDAWSHGRYAYMRGVENGYTVVRAARNGYLSVTTKTGKITMKEYAATPMATVLIANAPIA